MGALDGLNPTRVVSREEEIEAERAALAKIAEKADIAAKGFHDCAVAAEAAVKAMPKVVRCFSCMQYAFDGCLTAFETDEGVYNFCPECVAAIERRSKKPETAGVYVGDKLVGNATSVSIGYDYPWQSSLYRSPKGSFEISGYLNPSFDSTSFSLSNSLLSTVS